MYIYNIMSCPMYCVLSSYLPTGTIPLACRGTEGHTGAWHGGTPVRPRPKMMDGTTSSVSSECIFEISFSTFYPCSY